MNVITMSGLLRADREIQRLKRKSGSPVYCRQKIDDLFVDGDFSHIQVKFPRVLHSSAGRTGSGVAPVEFVRQTPLDPINFLIQIRVGKVDNSIAFFMQFGGD
jgi:hypothetical protein